MNVAANDKSAGQAHLEDYAISAVPVSERRSTLSVFVTSCAWIISLSTIFTGGALTSGLTFGDSIAAGFIGMLILAVYGFFQGWMGARYGVSTTMLARQSFGRRGAGLFGIVLAITLGIGWFAWQISFFGLTLAQMFPHQWFARPTVAMIWGGILMILTALIGYRGLAAISYIAVPLVFILSIWGLVAAVAHAGSWANLFHSHPTGAPITMFAGVTMVVGNAALGAVVFPDVTRYGKTPLKGGFGASIGYFLGGLFCVISGAAMSIAAHVPGVGTTPNIPAAMAELGLGFFAFLILVFAQWTTNDNNLYTGALGLRNVVRISKPVLASVMGIIAIIIAVSGLQNEFVPFLNFLGTYVPPIAGVMIADHWLVGPRIRGREYRFGTGTTYAQWNILAIVITILAGYVGSNLHFGISAINSTIIALLGYYLVALILKSLNVPFEFGMSEEDPSGF
ncbi:MAG: cytosine permease [Alicyclobacillus sp.]|nr:cytosine permease [Alicyclobacillus sp.]